MWCVIPAAGRSTRMLTMTRDRPKALLEVDGIPLITHLLDRLGAVVTDACIVVAPDGVEPLGRLGDRYGHLNLHYVIQPRATGVADAVSRSSSLVRGPFLVVMGDCYYDRTLTGFIDRWKGVDAAGAILVEPADAAGGQPMGLVRLTEGRIAEIFKAKWTGDTDWRVCGAYLFPESYFAAAASTPPSDSGEHELEDVVTRLMKDGTSFSAIRYGGWRRNINTPDDLAAVERRIAARFNSFPGA
jgi:glucose-1-phosphate thymidylyltransferase